MAVDAVTVGAASVEAANRRPGWYRDPWRSDDLRWWDGRTWTDWVHARPLAGGEQSLVPGVPVVPGVPEAPTMPEAPTTPEEPLAAEMPAAPVAPMAPATPIAPIAAMAPPNVSSQVSAAGVAGPTLLPAGKIAPTAATAEMLSTEMLSTLSTLPPPPVQRAEVPGEHGLEGSPLKPSGHAQAIRARTGRPSAWPTARPTVSPSVSAAGLWRFVGVAIAIAVLVTRCVNAFDSATDRVDLDVSDRPVTAPTVLETGIQGELIATGCDRVLAEPTSTAREMVVRLGVEWGEVFDTSMEEYASLAIDRCVAGAYGESVQPTHDGIRCSPADVSVLAAGPARYVGTCASVELVVVAVIGPCEVEAVYDEVQHSTIEEFRGAPSIFDGNAFGVGCVFEGLGDQQPTPGTRMSATVRVLAGRPEVIWGQQMRPSGTFEVVSFEIHR